MTDDFDAALDDANTLAVAVSSAPRHGEEPARKAEPQKIMFEGRVVDRTEIAIKGLAKLSDAYDGLKVGLDDRVRLVVETRASKVNHYMDKDGLLVRLQELQVSIADIVPWDPTNPDDDGVIRA